MIKYLFILVLFSCFMQERPDASKLYIAPNLDGTIEIIQFTGSPDSLNYIFTKKAPGITYDFFEEDILSVYRRDLKARKVGDRLKYRQQNDSIYFIIPNDEHLVVNYSGLLNNGKLYMKAIYALDGELVKITPNQVFHPY